MTKILGALIATLFAFGSLNAVASEKPAEGKKDAKAEKKVEGKKETAKTDGKKDAKGEKKADVK